MLTLTGMNFRFICVKAIFQIFLSQIIFPNEIKSGQKLKTSSNFILIYASIQMALIFYFVSYFFPRPI